MKNWAMIVIFLAAIVFSAAAQQPVKPQSAIINPGGPNSFASENPALQPPDRPNQPRRAASGRYEKDGCGIE